MCVRMGLASPFYPFHLKANALIDRFVAHLQSCVKAFVYVYVFQFSMSFDGMILPVSPPLAPPPPLPHLFACGGSFSVTLQLLKCLIL